MPTASMHASGPRPPVIALRRSNTSPSSKFIASAPPSIARRSRSGTSSIAMTRSAPSRNALRIANCPTGPQPHTATVSPRWMSQFSAAM